MIFALGNKMQNVMGQWTVQMEVMKKAAVSNNLLLLFPVLPSLVYPSSVFNVYLKGRMTYRRRKVSERFHLLVHFPSTGNGQGWARLKAGSWEST